MSQLAVSMNSPIALRTASNRSARCPATAFPSRTRNSPRQALKARAQSEGEGKTSSTKNDSYTKIEAPVRETTPDSSLYGGKPVQERNWGQDDLNPELRDNTPEWKPPGSDISAADAMRFTGAIPEVANARLAMLGVVAALVTEVNTGLNVFEQWNAASGPIVLTFLTLTLATAVPVFRGVPRRGNAIFTPNRELILGRIAMVGFLGLTITSFYKGHALWFLGF